MSLKNDISDIFIITDVF